MIRNSIPNFITLCNLMCGVSAVIVAFSGIVPFEIASLLIFAGAIFDFFDGFAARILKAKSAIGKELDSLADLITFGFAPAAILSTVIQHLLFGTIFPELETIVWQEYILILTPFIIVPFSALRLAKFNVDERQSHSFIGLPTPANALFFAAIIFYPDLSPILLVFLSIAFSLLLVSEIPMFSLKFISYSFSDNIFRYSFIAASVVAFAFFNLLALPFIILGYIVSSIILHIISKRTS